MENTSIIRLKAWKKYSGKIAFTTLWLTLIGVASYMLVVYLGISGKLNLALAAGINTVLAYILFTPLHEASHGNVRGKNKRYTLLEQVVGWLSGFPLTVPFPMFKYLHLTHHSHTNDPKNDPDYWVASKNPLFVVFKCATMIGDYYYFYFKDTKKLVRHPNHSKDFIVSMLGLLTFYSLFIYWGISLGWIYPLMLWIIPAVISEFFLAYMFDYLPHHPHSNRERWINTRIILFPGFNLLFLGQNYHLIHHLYPKVPFYSYKPVFHEMKSELEKRGAEITYVGKPSENPSTQAKLG